MIELMIVIMIIAILAALAYPSYINYIRKAKRGEAQQLLLNWAVNQEIFRSNNPQYATLAELPAPTHKNFGFSLPVRSATQYELRAQASGDQVYDTARDGSSCQVLTLTENGVKMPAACWE